ncbi:MAG: hypothetical protein AB1499_11380, partial [Nitrospirota bacterium]
RLSYQNIINGSFQDNFTKYFNQHIGFRPFFIKTYNQFYYSFFTTSPNTDVIFGKNNQLYISDYINVYYSKKQSINYSQMEDSIKELKKAQELFYEKGVIFLFLISANKASIYPEGIPDEFMTSETELNLGYKSIVTLMDKYNVNYIDGHEIFMARKKNAEYALFAKGGIHWNHYGASMVINNILEKAESLSKKNLTKIDLSLVDLDDYSKGKENDLAMLLNIWSTPIKEKYPHPRLQRIISKNEFKPNVLIIGSSFSELIAELFIDYSITNKLCRYYYYYSYANCTDGKSGDIGKLDWNKDVFRNDVIILEANEGLLPDRYGFIHDALTIMESHNIHPLTFSYENNRYVDKLYLDNRLQYRFKKGVPSSAVLLKSDGITIDKKSNYITVSFIAEGFDKIKCDLYPGKLLSSAKINGPYNYETYTYIFKTLEATMKDYTLQFIMDGSSASDKDTYIYDIKMYSTKH